MHKTCPYFFSCKGRLRSVSFWLSPHPFRAVCLLPRDVVEVPMKDTAFPHLQQHHLAVHHAWLLLAVGLYTAHKVWVGRIHPLHEHHQGMLVMAEKYQQSSKAKRCQSPACNIPQQELFSQPKASSKALITTRSLSPWSAVLDTQKNPCRHAGCFNYA